MEAASNHVEGSVRQISTLKPAKCSKQASFSVFFVFSSLMLHVGKV